jgi:succinate dehydrogenase/fumarate reductase cytochrome b subunit
MSSPEPDWTKKREKAVGRQDLMFCRARAVFFSACLFLGLFMWGHMAFVSTILISKDTMWWVTKMFEGQFLFGKSYPGVVSAIVIVVSTRFVLHGALALRKVPANFRSTETSPAIEKCCATGYYALVGSGGHRFCATLFRFRAPLPDAHAPG